MTDRDEVIGQRAAASAADVAENGPRLWVGRHWYILARGDKKVLRGGLGVFGIGTMWCPEEQVERIHGDGLTTSPDREDPTYADAPYDPDRRDDFGDWGWSGDAPDGLSDRAARGSL